MFRILMMFLLVSFAIVVIFLLLDALLGHRLLIPLARILKFKIDDVERTEKKVKEILGEEDAEEDNTKKTDGRTKKKRD